MSKDLAGIPGKEATMITVDYAPGASDVIHRHNAHALVYVLQGTAVMQLRGGQQQTLRPGQTFYEQPQDIHLGAYARRSENFVLVVHACGWSGALRARLMNARRSVGASYVKLS